MADVVLFEVADRVATITLNRPRARNALSTELLASLGRLVSEADTRDDVDVLILTGSDPAFCAGLDLKELGVDGGPLRRTRSSDDTPTPSDNTATPPDNTATPPDNTATPSDGTATPSDGTATVDPGPPPRRLHRGPTLPTSKPIIGAVNGVAVTGGLELALNCDFLVASDRARFADTHSRVGVHPLWGLTVTLPQAVGIRRAREMSATGNFIDARLALQWGLVNHVVDHDELLPFARRLAADIVSSDQRAVGTILATYEEVGRVPGHEAREVETRAAAVFQRGGVVPAEIERRRQDIVDRGRTQV